MDLKDFFKECPKTAIGFSGGVDSAFLLAMGVKYGADIKPYFIKTAFQPEFELEDAKRLTDELGVELTVIELDILGNRTVAENPIDRCYHCKTALFGALKQRAPEDGYTVLLDGTNASDDASDRPGMRAIRELQVRSPLRECGLTKTDIRRISREEKIFTWNKPSYACLATRVPSGEKLTAEKLHAVEVCENALMAMGFTDFRIRMFHGAARIQLPEEQFGAAIAEKDKIRESLTPFFDGVLLDLVPRSSQND